MEPADVWQSRLPKKYLDTGPRIVRAPLKEISFLGGRFRPVMGAPGDEGPLGDWWLYEELQRPLTRLDTAVGYSRDEITPREQSGSPPPSPSTRPAWFNGAQTVSSAFRAYERDPEAVAEAYVVWLPVGNC